MSLKRIDIIAGARPNFIKIATIIKNLEARHQEGGSLRYRLVHTGQHYDSLLSGSFFEQLKIPKPQVNLGVGSGSHAEQTGAIMTNYEALLLKEHSKDIALCLVVGDVNSTLACAITAKKLGIPVVHVEAGIRCGDWSMPEEINRVVTDAIADWFFTTSETAGANLRCKGVRDEQIFFVGNTMIDTLLANLPKLKKPEFFDELGLQQGEYFVLTLHRPANVDNDLHFFNLLQAIGRETRGLPIIFPAHPRASKTLQKIDKIPACIKVVEPQPYWQFNYLVKNAKAVLTDSGGVSEETTVLGIPCLTFRTITERPETVNVGTNLLVGVEPKLLKEALVALFAGQWKCGAIPEKWDGKAGERIVAALERLLAD